MFKNRLGHLATPLYEFCFFCQDRRDSIQVREIDISILSLNLVLASSLAKLIDTHVIAHDLPIDPLNFQLDHNVAFHLESLEKRSQTIGPKQLKSRRDCNRDIEYSKHDELGDAKVY